eukprot:19213-Pyramimonas_sp.AAC.1
MGWGCRGVVGGVGRFWARNGGVEVLKNRGSMEWGCRSVVGAWWGVSVGFGREMVGWRVLLSLIHISEPTRPEPI